MDSDIKGNEAGPRDLRRLGFLSSFAASVAHNSENFYKILRSYVPHNIITGVHIVEERFISHLAPVFAKGQDLGDELLRSLDEKVDIAMTGAESWIGRSEPSEGGYKDSGALVLVGFLLIALQSMVLNARACAAWAARKFRDLTEIYCAGQSCVQSWAAYIQSLLDLDLMFDKIKVKGGEMADGPAVSEILSHAKPATDFACNAFATMHDSLVRWGGYKAGIDAAGKLVDQARHSAPYRYALQYMYPLVQPVAEPTMARLSKSRVVSSAVEYWRPVATVA